ncbi:hypothetical protein F5888DRAFT_1632981 [Russula emetica]|nr:hypothetical protein F5888DRAFT_1632981 [Russula emetica]
MVETSCELSHQFTSGDVSSLTAYVILFYDYFLTLPMEVDRYWCPGSHTWASALFLVIRYVALLGHVPLLYRMFGDPCEVMHTGVIYDRSDLGWILFIVTLEFIAGFLLACWTLTKLLPGVAATDTERRARLQGEAFSGLLVFDFTVFVLTMARSIKLWTHKEPFLKRIFIDGLLYYGYSAAQLFWEAPLADRLCSVIWNLNLVNVIILFVTNPVLDLSTPIFTNVLSVVMISRLMINLRDPTIHSPADRDETVTTSHVGYLSTLVLDDTHSNGELVGLKEATREYMMTNSQRPPESAFPPLNNGNFQTKYFVTCDGWDHVSK